jgi:predicted transposase/invertase (TIGR01784 family)
VSGPHDALFRYVFSQPDNAASELRSVLPAQLSQRLDWSSLELQSSTFVDERLSGRQADLLFMVRCDGQRAYLYVLLEHQSTVDPLMGFRLLRYIVRIWDTILVEHPETQRLPAIIPVVLHHSGSGWSGATDLHSSIDLEVQTRALVAPYVPQFAFVLDDISHADDHALRGRSLTAVAAAGLLLLARGRNGPTLIDDLRRWLDVLAQVANSGNGVEALSALLEYAFRVGDVLPEDLRKLALQLGPTAHEAYMTAAQKLTAEFAAESYARGIAEGKAEGIAEGKAEGIAEGKAEGIAEGKAEGIAEGKAALLLRLLDVRFGSVSESTRQRVLLATPERLDLWAERVITGASLEDVLA